MRESRILMGVIGRPHGVRGRVRVTSYTADPMSLTEYGPLTDASGRAFVLRWEGEGIAAVSRIVDGAALPVADRNAAERLTNTQLYLARDRLPSTEEDEFYLADLVGLAAVDQAGASLGYVAGVHDYGAGASLEIARAGGPPLLVPFTKACVPDVDLAGARLVVAIPAEVAGEAAPA